MKPSKKATRTFLDLKLVEGPGYKRSRLRPQKYPQSPEKLKTPLIPPLMLPSNL
jgi:hypothetical protein